MNVRMWQHAATQRNIEQLRADGITVLEPDEGPMACGEFGPGRLPEPADISRADQADARTVGNRASSRGRPGPLAGKHVLVTAGPTHEPIDPVRVIANRSSGKQGFAIAAAAAAGRRAGHADRRPVSPANARRRRPDRCRDRAANGRRGRSSAARRRRDPGRRRRRLEGRGRRRPSSRNPTARRSSASRPTPTSSRRLATHPDRPRLLIGFAAETHDVVANAKAKLASQEGRLDRRQRRFRRRHGRHRNRVHLITDGDGPRIGARWTRRRWPTRLIERVAAAVPLNSDSTPGPKL